jgi:membrane-associated phospholipid phosphatase
MSTAGTTRELRTLLAVQRAFRHRAAVAAAHALGAAGEHAAVWLVVGAVGTVTDRRHRRAWLAGTRTVLVAHALSVGLKRVVRRARPAHAALRVPPGRVGRWGMPSSHAASTTAAAIAFAPLLPAGPAAGVAALLPPAMGLSRLVVGAHFPTDVVAGSALGAATALAARLRRVR